MGGSITLADFMAQVARAAGLPVTATTIGFLDAMAQKEGGHFHNSCTFNPLNTSLKVSGSHACTGAIQAYPSFSVGVSATAKTIRLGYYSKVRAALAKGDVKTAGIALQASGWCGGPSKPCPGYGSAVVSLYPATTYGKQKMARGSGTGSTSTSSGGGHGTPAPITGSSTSSTSSHKARTARHHPSTRAPLKVKSQASTGGYAGCSAAQSGLIDSELARAAASGNKQQETITVSDLAGYRAGRGSGAVSDGLSYWEEELAALSRSVGTTLTKCSGGSDLQAAYGKGDPLIVEAFNTGSAPAGSGLLGHVPAYLKIAAGGLIIAAGGAIVIAAIGLGSKAAAAYGKVSTLPTRGAVGRGKVGGGGLSESPASGPRYDAEKVAAFKARVYPEKMGA